MKNLFFDTCGLQHRYVRSKYSARVNRLINNPRNRVHIAELGVVEMASTLAAWTRRGRLSVAEYDQAQSVFMSDLAAGTLRVRSATRQSMLNARHLIRYAGVKQGSGLKSADAIIATVALELAQESNEFVSFYTSDRPFFFALRKWDAFCCALNLVLLGETKDGTKPTSYAKNRAPLGS